MLSELSEALAAANAVTASLGGHACARDPAKQAHFVKLLATCAAKPGFDIDARDSDGRTLLQKACMQRSEDQPALVKLLLEHKASPNVVDATGSMPLYYAALSGGEAAVTQLKEAAGDGFAAMTNATNKNGETPLMAAAASGATTVCGLLIESGADVSALATGGVHEGRSASQQRVEPPQTP